MQNFLKCVSVINRVLLNLQGPYILTACVSDFPNINRLPEHNKYEVFERIARYCSVKKSVFLSQTWYLKYLKKPFFQTVFLILFRVAKFPGTSHGELFKKWRVCIYKSKAVNRFSTNVSLLYTLKRSENWRFPDVFRVYRSGTLVENGLIIK